MITMGYGHLTIITMGLGNSIRILTQRRRRQWGAVEFENIPTEISMTEVPTTVSIEEEKRKVEATDIEEEVDYE